MGRPLYNFSYVDPIYDGLLAKGVRPFEEISFMPKELALRQDLHPCIWYKWNGPVVSPPKDYAKWDGLIQAFAEHLVDRYEIDEVAQWYIEVWNEPNIDFWTGDPKQATYFELYDRTARALKSISPASAWADQLRRPPTGSIDFIRHAAANNVPTDFISSHGYADDTVEDLFGASEDIPMVQRLCRAV